MLYPARLYPLVLSGLLRESAGVPDVGTLPGGSTGGTTTAVAAASPLAPARLLPLMQSRLVGSALGAAVVVPPPSGGGGVPLDGTGLGFFPLSGPTYRGRAAAENQRVYLGNAYTVVEKIERQTVATGRWDGVSGLALTVFLADTPDGAHGAIGALAAALPEVAGSPGVYAVSFPASVVAALVPFADQTVYEIISDGVSLTIYNEVLVRSSREGS
jgi:hypothetical protein